MNQPVARILLFIMVQVSLLTTMTTSLFASEPVFTLVPTGISGRVWIDSNDSGNFEQQEPPLANLPVFIQRIDQSDFAMTLVVYTDGVGGFAVEGLPTGTYQIWIENVSGGVFLRVVTIDGNTPVATADLPLIGHRVFMPTIMR